MGFKRCNIRHKKKPSVETEGYKPKPTAYEKKKLITELKFVLPVV